VSNLFIKCIWWVTNTIVLPFKYFINTVLNICFPTCESKALKQSSTIIISRLEYTALAILIRCFYPPLKFTPSSPISVRSPPANWAISSVNSQIFKIFLYRFESKLSPKIMLSRRLQERSQGYCEQNIKINMTKLNKSKAENNFVWNLFFLQFMVCMRCFRWQQLFQSFYEVR